MDQCFSRSEVTRRHGESSRAWRRWRTGAACCIGGVSIDRADRSVPSSDRWSARSPDADEPLYDRGDARRAGQWRIGRPAFTSSGTSIGAHLVPDGHVEAARTARTSPANNGGLSRSGANGHRLETAIDKSQLARAPITVICVRADAWTAAGYRVLGAAVKTEKRRGPWLRRPDRPAMTVMLGIRPIIRSPVLPLTCGRSVVVDEASTLSDRDLDITQLEMVDHRGEPRRSATQPSIVPSLRGAYSRALCERHERDTPELVTAHPVPRPPPCGGLGALRGVGSTKRSTSSLAGHLHIVADDLAMYREVLGRWTPTATGSSIRWSIGATAPAASSTVSPTSSGRANGELDGDGITASGDRHFAVRRPDHRSGSPNRDLPRRRRPARAYVRNGASARSSPCALTDVTSPTTRCHRRLRSHRHDRHPEVVLRSSPHPAGRPGGRYRPRLRPHLPRR